MSAQSVKSLFLSICLLAVSSQAEDHPFLNAKVKTLVAFKDGTVFVMKEGRVTVGKSGKVVTSPITDAAFGTVGVNSLTKGVSVRMLTASAAPTTESTARSFADARNQACGRPVSVRRRGSDTLLSGELLGLRAPGSVAEAVGMTAVEKADDFILSIKQDDGLITLLPMSDVEEWHFLDREELDRDPERTGQHLTISLTGAKTGDEVTIAYYYLWQGVRWTPSYLLERGKDGRVALELRGEIKNDLIDLKGTRVFFVVGVPNFAFVKSPSPMVAQKTLRQVTAALQQTAAYARNDFSNGQFNQMVSNSQMRATIAPLEVRQPTVVETTYAPAAELPDAQSTDAGSLHLYEMGNIDLGKGERAIVNLDSMTLNCRDLVVWDVVDARVDTATHMVTPADRAANPLVHYWMLEAGDTPLTTGPALVMKGDVALSQDRIFYTPRHTAGRFKAGTAVGVAGVATETVLSREPGVKEVNDRQTHHAGKAFWLKKEIRWVDELRELTLQVNNGLAFETDMAVTRTFKGRPEANGEVSLRALGGMSDTEDEIHQLTWKVTLKAGETKEITLRYTARVFTQT
ncbi:MAG: hypothetical protein RRC34_12350 [Lentisphaeria bacterium]|nr:hypothetical protein [Lentisphaeria bacterium]